MRKLFTFLFVLTTLTGFSQGITVTVGDVAGSADTLIGTISGSQVIGGVNADSLANQPGNFYFDTATNQSASGLKIFRDQLEGLDGIKSDSILAQYFGGTSDFTIGLTGDDVTIGTDSIFFGASVYDAINDFLGIGTPSSKPLTLKGTGGNPKWINLNDANGTLWGIDGNSGGILIEEEGTNDKNLFIEDGGDVGIGTTTLEGRLTIDNNSNDPKLVITPRTSGSLNSSIELHGNSSINSEGGIIQYLNGDKEFVFNNVDADGGAGGDIAYHFQVDDVDQMVIQKDGNIGFGTNTPHAPLQFANSTGNRKIVIFEDANNTDQFYGFGHNFNTLRYQVGNTSADHIFFAGVTSSSSNELMRIKGTGNVGIGMVSPVANTTPGVLQLGLANATAIPTGTVTGGGILYSTAGILHWLKADGTDIDLTAGGGGSDGWTDAGSNVHLTTITDLVGIGTITPIGKIEVIGTNDSYWRLRETNVHQMLHHGNSSRHWSIAPRDNNKFSIASQSSDPGTGIISKGNDDFTIDEDGNISGPFGSYHVASDSTLKENITTIDSALYKIDQMRGVNFSWKDTSLTAEMQYGIIAQELEQIIPTLVHTDTFGIKSVEWWQLNGLFVEAIKELNQPIEWLDIQRKAVTDDQTGIDQGTDILLDSANGNIPYNSITGVVSLKAGKPYVLWGAFAAFSISTSETVAIQWVKASDNAPLYEGHETRLRPQSSTSNGNNLPTIKMIYKPTVDIDVKLRCTEHTGTPDTFTLYWDRSFATINELR